MVQKADWSAALTAGDDHDEILATINPLIQLGSTVVTDNPEDLHSSEATTYGRQGLSPCPHLARAMATIEKGADAQLYSSGLSAICNSILALTQPGDHILLVDCVYGRTREFCDEYLSRLGISVTYFDPAIGVTELFDLARENTKMIFLESPGSITFEIQDVSDVSKRAQSRNILTLVDNTWSAGILSKPIPQGADVSIQSLTKYVSGDSDTFMGCAVSRSPAIHEKLHRHATLLGLHVDPLAAYRVLKGLRTLPTRLARHGDSALQIANWLRNRPEVETVLYPALKDTTYHQLWRANFSGSNGLVSIVLSNQMHGKADLFLRHLKRFKYGFSWGGFDSLAVNCTSKISSRKKTCRSSGDLLRLHIGLDDPEALMNDLAAALEHSAARDC